MTTTKLSVPYYSQRLDVSEEYWQDRSCGVVCLKMALDFVTHEISPPSIENLIIEGVAIGGHNPAYGWVHDALVALAHNHGVCAYREEWRSIDIAVGLDGKLASKKEPGKHSRALVDQGLEKLKSTLHAGKVVIVSIVRKRGGQESFHMILLTGVDLEAKSGFYYHDPDAFRQEEGEGLFMDFATFQKYWRRLAIFVY